MTLGKLLDYADLSPSESLEFLNELAEYIDPLVIEDFATENTPYHRALGLVSSQESHLEDLYRYNPPPASAAVELVGYVPAGTIAYSLVYEQSQYASDLLDELLYYRTQGRI